MTTIAWDTKTLAADTLSTGPDDNGVYFGPKIHRTPHGLFAGCGDDGPIQAALEWIRAGAPSDERPPPIDAKETLGGLLIRPDGGVAVLSEKFFLIDYFQQQAAMGSGGDFALAFMRMGMSAPEAVQRVIDLRLDINTGGDVQTLTLNKRKAGKSKS